MNTHGHKDVAEVAGIPVLQAAFERAGKGKPRLAAFYLGNWLTDVSQAIDPLATQRAIIRLRAVKDDVDKLAEQLLNSLYVEIGGSKLRLEVLDDAVQGARRQIHRALDFLTASGKDSPRAQLEAGLRDGLRFIGYFQFAHPHKPGDQPPLDLHTYLAVFNARFTQYYPHEHLDRPEIFPPVDPPQYATEIAGRTRSPRSARVMQPDLYSYLRDDIEMIAATLAEVDQGWARRTFMPGASVDDGDLEWNLWLARLGHALHGVEDFFAHSNFIEHAALRLGGRLVPWEAQLLDDEIFSHRLKRWEPASFPDWRDYADEDHVVTGYFDFRDSIISLAHVAEELLGPPAAWVTRQAILHDAPRSRWLDPKGEGRETQENFLDEVLEFKDPARDAREIYDAVARAADSPEAVVFEAQTILRETLDIFSDPQRAFEDTGNGTARKIKGIYEPDLIRLRRPLVDRQILDAVIRESDLLRVVPPEIQAAFVNTVLVLTKAYIVGEYALSAYETVKTLVAFIDKPADWLAKLMMLKGVALIPGAVLFYARELLYDYIGQKRIGCHSLLAKDHGREWLYPYQKQCAMAVHWYIMSIMTRWAPPDGQDPSAPRRWIDWLELLEYFLRHPMAEQFTLRTSERDMPVTIVHVVQERPRGAPADSLANLASRYIRSAYRPQHFTPAYEFWERIADANFNTYDLPRQQRMEIINQTLKASGWGYPVTPPNYAFKPGLHVLIPEQRLSIRVIAPVRDDQPWFKPVIEQGWEVFRGHEDPLADQSVAPLRHHSPVVISQSELNALIQSGNKLRRAAEAAYAPGS